MIHANDPSWCVVRDWLIWFRWGENFSPKLGGGPFNVAVALGRLGSDVGFVSRLSTDASEIG